jgi:hypothetical protein
MEDFGLSTLVTDRVTKLSSNGSDTSSQHSFRTTKSHCSPDQFYSPQGSIGSVPSTSAQNISDSAFYNIDLHLSKEMQMGRDFLYDGDYEDDTAPSESSESDGEIDEFQLQHLIKAVETHFVAPGKYNIL